MDPLHQMTYALSDPHGCLDVLEQALSSIDLSGDAHLYLLGDYVPHEKTGFGSDGAVLTGMAWLTLCMESLEMVRDFEAAHPGKVSVLPGNHELMLLDRVAIGELVIPRDILRWLRRLRKTPFLETERQVFVHAGVDEEAGEYWRWGSDPAFFCEKYPPSVGAFEVDIVAGHVNVRQAAQLAGVVLDDEFQGVFWDGESHYYIDGTTERSGVIPILRYDAVRGEYTQRIVTAAGAGGWLPVDRPRHADAHL